MHICMYIYMYIYMYTYMYIWKGGSLEWDYPQISHFNKAFHCKPSIWGYPIHGTTCINEYIYICMYIHIQVFPLP